MDGSICMFTIVLLSNFQQVQNFGSSLQSRLWQLISRVPNFLLEQFYKKVFKIRGEESYLQVNVNVHPTRLGLGFLYCNSANPFKPHLLQELLCHFYGRDQLGHISCCWCGSIALGDHDSSEKNTTKINSQGSSWGKVFFTPNVVFPSPYFQKSYEWLKKFTLIGHLLVSAFWKCAVGLGHQGMGPSWGLSWRCSKFDQRFLPVSFWEPHSCGGCSQIQPLVCSFFSSCCPTLVSRIHYLWWQKT